MNKGISPERIEEIIEQSMPFPLMLQKPGSSQPNQIIYVDSVEKPGNLLMPNGLSLIKEDEDGWSTVAYYELVECVKEKTDQLREDGFNQFDQSILN
jgi:hypothetical protein